MVTLFGMSSKVGPRALRTLRQSYLEEQGYAGSARQGGPQLQKTVDDEIDGILQVRAGRQTLFRRKGLSRFDLCGAAFSIVPQRLSQRICKVLLHIENLPINAPPWNSKRVDHADGRLLGRSLISLEKAFYPHSQSGDCLFSAVAGCGRLVSTHPGPEPGSPGRDGGKAVVRGGAPRESTCRLFEAGRGSRWAGGLVQDGQLAGRVSRRQYIPGSARAGVARMTKS